MKIFITKLFFIVFLLISASCDGQVPKIGDSLKLEIANWNLEWFGKMGYGPTDEALQQSNILDVIQKTDIDIWTFCEVSNNAAFDSMMLGLPNYEYIICNYSPEQKTAVIFKKNQFRLIRSELLGVNNPDSFTTGRYPFLVVLKSLTSIGLDTLHLIALHLKANYGTTTEKLSAYNSRLRSGEWLKMYLNLQQIDRYCMVLGDWNDDLDESIFNGLPSPYANLLENDVKFKFITQKFTDTHIGTTISYPDAIDHQLVSLPLYNFLKLNSTNLLYLNQFIPSYGTTTSDHLPVYSFFNRTSSSVYSNLKSDKIYLYPNPTTDNFTIVFKGFSYNSIVKIFDMNGKKISEQHYNQDERVDIRQLPSGCYQIVVTDGQGIFSRLLQINH